jgi:sulfate adenylyltransferase subunit 1 (EFTu-like GTPase family)
VSEILSFSDAVEGIEHRLDVTALVSEPAHALELNAIGRVRFRVGAPIIPDPPTGSAQPAHSS